MTRRDVRYGANMTMASSSHGFSLSSLERKVKDLNTTLQSIQGTSQWLIHYRKHAKIVVSYWYKEIQKVDSNRKLTLLYLANDVIQTGKKKGPEYRIEFTKVLPRTLQIVSRDKDVELKKSVERIVNVWEERKVFEPDVIIRFKSMLVSGSLHPHRRTRSESDMKRNATMPDSKRVKLDKSKDSPTSEEPPNNRKPPDPEELVRRLQAIDGDKSAVRDMTTRQKIANFQPETHNPDLLSTIKDKTAAEELAKDVEEASKVLSEYNKRLESELKERTELQDLLDAFIWQQKTLLKDAKKNLREFQGKMEQVMSVKEELKSHLANLPDFSQLPMGSKTTLAPLPAAGELFN